MNLEAWAIDNLSQLLGIDDETLKTQVLPYLMSYDSPDALGEHLMVFYHNYYIYIFRDKTRTNKDYNSTCNYYCYFY